MESHGRSHTGGSREEEGVWEEHSQGKKAKEGGKGYRIEKCITTGKEHTIQPEKEKGMKKKMFLVGLAALVLVGFSLSPAIAEESAEDSLWSAGTVTEYLEGQSITIKAPGENEGEEVSLTFVITDETEFYEEVAVEQEVEIEHTGDTALYVQLAKEE